VSKQKKKIAEVFRPNWKRHLGPGGFVQGRTKLTHRGTGPPGKPVVVPKTKTRLGGTGLKKNFDIKKGEKGCLTTVSGQRAMPGEKLETEGGLLGVRSY